MLQKLTQLQREYRNTVIQKGSPTLFFFYFWLTKFLSFLQQHSEPLNRLVHRIVRHVPHPEFTIRNTSGTFIVEPFDDSTTICSDYFEAHLRPWLTKPLRKDLCIDIGANRGLYTILALTSYGYAEVHAFEPNPDVAQTLIRNAVLNNVSDRMTLHTVGLGDTESVVHFTVDEMHKGGGRIAEHGTTATLTVPIKPLDSILSETNALRTSFIKIDTEGYEFQVLSGMNKTLRAMPEGSCLMIESTDHDCLVTILAPYEFIHQETLAHDHLFMKRHA